MTETTKTNDIQADVELVAKFITSPESAKRVGHENTIEAPRAVVRLISGFLNNIQRIADAQEKTAALLEADATPQTLVRVEERRK